MLLLTNVFHRSRKFVPSFLNDCPLLRFVSFIFGDLFTEFPTDDSAAASDGQAVAKWLFTPLQNNMPKMIHFIDQNAIAFLRRFRQHSPTVKSICVSKRRVIAFRRSILHNIWPLLGKNIRVMDLSATFFRRLRQFAPSILNNCPSLYVFNAYYFGFFSQFPCDDSAAASEGQALAKENDCYCHQFSSTSIVPE
ncbi:hypothetical protein niasHT_026139 [Heterodera trifolii]|uniref:Uncharacterized protein n=1 Tax=Heterodera trifolii TaxID=157864 RepID=A0ABD2K057_9BILA